MYHPEVFACVRARLAEADHPRFHEQFDGFQTLRFIHKLRARRYPSLPWRDALAQAPFASSSGDLESVRDALFQAEASLGDSIGQGGG